MRQRSQWAKDFDEDFAFNRRWFRRIFTAAVGFIGLVFAFIIAVYVGYGVVAYKTFNYVSDNGLKAVVERVWEGDKNE